MKNHPKPNSFEWYLILGFVFLKLAFHFLTYDNFELHRDAYLYYAQGQHLAWGYVAVPPFTAFVGKIATSVFGNTTFALRFFPAIVGGLNMIIIGLAVKEIGGSKRSIILASLAYLLSPAYLHTNFMFQPVAFNQFFWFLFMYLTLAMIKRDNPKVCIPIAITLGFGFLTKYSIVFVAAGFALALLISPKRYLFLSRYLLFALLIGFLIVLPNLIWQIQHNWPVLMHMSELRSMQLVNVQYSDFFIGQLLMNIQAILIWMLGVLGFLIFKDEKEFRLYTITYLAVILIILAGRGKPYYTLGIYPIYFVFGSFFIEKYFGKHFKPLFAVLVIHMLVSLYISQSFDGIPLMTFEKIEKKDAFRWEDGKNYDIPQDMADMTGWNEIGSAVKEIYQDLGPENSNSCHICCGHYGQAGAVMFHGKDIDIPDPISPNGSFAFWAPDSLTADYLIYVHSDLNNSFDPEATLPQFFEKVELVKTVRNHYFREDGTRIYLCENPTMEGKDFYRSMMKALKDRYR